MTESRPAQDATPKLTNQPGVRGYPTNHVVGIIDTPEQLASAVTALTSGGFLPSEVTVLSGPAGADALKRSIGHTGLANLAIRVAEALHIANDEMEGKQRYVQALGDGKWVVKVLAASEERKTVAGQILQDHGGHFVNFMGSFAIEGLHP